MLTAAILILAVTFFPRAVAVIDPAISDMVNNLLNAIMIAYIARLDKKITPRVQHIDKAVAASIDTRVEGGRREHDPPEISETSATSATP